MPPLVLRVLDVQDAAAVHRSCAAPAVAAPLGMMPTDAVSVFEGRTSSCTSSCPGFAGS